MKGMEGGDIPGREGKCLREEMNEMEEGWREQEKGKGLE